MKYAALAAFLIVLGLVFIGIAGWFIWTPPANQVIAIEAYTPTPFPTIDVSGREFENGLMVEKSEVFEGVKVIDNLNPNIIPLEICEQPPTPTPIVPTPSIEFSITPTLVPTVGSTPTPAPSVVYLPPIPLEELAMAGTYVPSVPVIEGDDTAVLNTDVSVDNIISPDPTGMFRILIIPVGYPDSVTRRMEMDMMVNNMESLMDTLDLNVGYAYLDMDLPVGFFKIGNMVASNPELGMLMEKVQNEVYPFHNRVVFLYENIGRSNTGVILRTVGDSYRIVAHETGHYLGLGDAYPRFYFDDELIGAGRSELFVDIDTRNWLWWQALTETEKVVETSPYVCHGKQVYAPYATESSGMSARYNDGLLFAMPEIFFSRFQRRYMQLYIEYVLSQKP